MAQPPNVNSGDIITSAYINTIKNGLFTWLANVDGGGFTLSNATLAGVTISGHPTIEGVTSTGATGTGAFVFGTSPSIAAPTITGHPTVEGVTSTGATGTAKMVFSNAPTFTGGINVTGVIAGSSDIFAGNVGSIYWNGRSQLLSNANGNIQLSNQARNDFGLLQFGALTNAYPALKRSGTSILVRLADDSGDAGFGVGTLSQTGLTTKYNNVTTAGLGHPAIYGSGRSTAQTAAVASVATYTAGAADGTFVVSANVNVLTATTHSFTVTVTYTDETNTSRTATLTFSQLAGTMVTTITNTTGAGPYMGVPLHIRAKASTAITVATTGTFTTVTYNVEGCITQIG